MNINNILVVSPMYIQLEMLLEKEGLQKDIRYLPEEQMKDTDLLWADALVTFNLKTTLDYTHVKWVHSLGAGVDRFVYKKKWNEGVLLTRTICSFGQRIAEYALSYILKDLQEHTQFETLQQQKMWQPITPRLLNQQKVLIYGTGEIGQAVAKIFSLLGVKVYGVSLSGREKEFFTEVMSIGAEVSRLGKMDYIINTLPLTEKTTNLFNTRFFEHLSNAGFFNVGRGASLDENALIAAITNNQVRFAILDVFANEPLPAQHPFWTHPNITITPHISAVTTPEEGVACFIKTLKNIEKNKPIINKVDIKKGY
jgi:glyoxylate/hydroxypyruvate reductase